MKVKKCFYIKCLSVTRLSDSQAVFINTACTILTELASLKPLPLADECDQGLSKVSIANKLKTQLRKAKDKKVIIIF